MRTYKRKPIKTEEIKTKNLFDISATIASEFFKKTTYPFEILPEISKIIKALVFSLNSDYIEPEKGIFVHKSAVIAPFAKILAPCIICENAEIRHCAFIRGNAIIGKACVVGNSTEIKNSVLFDGAKAPHFNYVGDSVLGKNAHLGAGVICSNLRLDKNKISIKTESSRLETGLKKAGAFVGDGAEIGCNSVLNPAAIIRRGEYIFPQSVV